MFMLPFHEWFAVIRAGFRRRHGLLRRSVGNTTTRLGDDWRRVLASTLMKNASMAELLPGRAIFSRARII